MVRLDDLLDRIRSYNATADLEAVRRAYLYSESIHEGRVRLSGESYLEHLLEVAHILVQLRMDVPTIITGLLHDVFDNDLASREDLQKEFGEEIATLVDGVTKISKIFFRTSEESQAENVRKMLLAMARDIRVIMVKLADRLHNMRTLEARGDGDQLRIAQETLDIYAPLANRLGISWIKGELEDLSFSFLNPEAFGYLVSRIARKKKEQERYIEEVLERLKHKLQESGIEGDVSGRFKHLYSAHRKMERQGLDDIDQLYDLIAFRIIVPTVRDCYAVLGIIHAGWKPIPGRFKDYIAMPKANMYQSLHTAVIGPFGERIEVQIRTEEMHRVAEEGIAAHWKYKEGGGAAVGGRDDKRFGWLRQLLEWQQEVKDSRDFMDAVRIDLFPEEVYVFTPQGDVKELPKGSTAIDFAYSVHSDVGNHCVGGRVNGKLVPLKTELKNGDVVEVMTSANQTPRKDWLKLVRTSKARNKIRQWIKTEQREKSIELARDLLDKEMRKYGSSLKQALSGNQMQLTAEELGFKGVEDLLAALGYGKVSVGQIVTRIVPQEKLRALAPKPGRLGKVLEKIRRKPAGGGIKVQGIDDIMVRFAHCCQPLPGDPVIGFITRGRGVTVHAADCPHVLEADPDRRIEVEWDMQRKATRPAKIRVFCMDQKGVLAGITGAITNCEANIISANVSSTADRKGINIFQVDVQDLEHLNKVLNEVRKIKGVYKVERMRS